MNRPAVVPVALLAACAAVAADPGAPPEKAEERFMNVLALKGIPADDLVPAMQFISASLGVDCDFCHVDRKPEADDKKKKLVAREMIELQRSINRNFNGHVVVTCMTCHRGSTRPEAVPPVADGSAPPAQPPAPAALPEVTAVLDAYVKAVGGKEAMAAVASRVQTGKLTGFGPEPFPVEIHAKAPNKRISIVKTPRGENITAFDGSSGWLGGGQRPAKDMGPGESRAASLDADLDFPADVRERFKEVRVVAPETIDGKPATHLVARNEGEPPVELFFDPASGLLLRAKRYVETPLGRLPTEIDYADWRDAGGVKVPFRWTVARPSGRFTIQIEETRSNVPVDDAKFRKGA
ncbi:MAG TPA: photosynthetic reaction center cytochrome c subunit family protein [Candidatus Polarisedimenticolaceae bacterium]